MMQFNSVGDLGRVCKNQIRNPSTSCAFRNLLPRSKWPKQSVLIQNAVGGGNGPTGGQGGGNDGGRGGGDGDRSNEPQKGNGTGLPFLAGIMKGWEDRVKYDPEFPFKIFIEQVIGVGMSVIGDMSSRPNWGLNELDFVFRHVGSILNFTVMFTLAPTAATSIAASAGGNFFTKAMSDHYLKGWGAPGGNMFEPGIFTGGQRLINFCYKGVVFSGIGFLAGMLGTTITNCLLLLRKNLDPNFKLVNEPPNIIYNAGTWALHMGLSSNLRYQVLGGSDQVLLQLMPITAFRLYQTFIRALNNVIGGISFVTLARVLGVQKSGQVEATA
ncbi:hypothetical protein CEUSTIGMA_g3501.t1 [Chlamydomonas eustigma]|uniref:Uncharacterized protein n=1 Tax=Chlamydomonas eustigma TaxID=1157962 RepID=A0A250WYZ2_9CHLO|nr:hypothetical protein CEUSTIGMA_g3501.t1 [Chlamydomonas eustigma]|eukprot:GAX76058.1 hypothetical protein CEUSTIGMA_g3501.t1 [Chlamydomonas eustigma]